MPHSCRAGSNSRRLNPLACLVGKSFQSTLAAPSNSRAHSAVDPNSSQSARSASRSINCRLWILQEPARKSKSFTTSTYSIEEPDQGWCDCTGVHIVRISGLFGQNVGAEVTQVHIVVQQIAAGHRIQGAS